MTTVCVVRPRPGGGYAVDTVRTGPVPRGRRTFTADHVVMAAAPSTPRNCCTGCAPTVTSRRCRPGSGYASRTNSESLVGAVSRRPDVDFTRGVAITSSFHPDPQTHVEPVRYGRGSNLMGLLGTVLTDGVPGTPAMEGVAARGGRPTGGRAALAGRAPVVGAGGDRAGHAVGGQLAHGQWGADPAGPVEAHLQAG